MQFLNRTITILERTLQQHAAKTEANIKTFRWHLGRPLQDASQQGRQIGAKDLQNGGKMEPNGAKWSHNGGPRGSKRIVVVVVGVAGRAALLVTRFPVICQDRFFWGGEIWGLIFRFFSGLFFVCFLNVFLMNFGSHFGDLFNTFSDETCECFLVRF